MIVVTGWIIDGYVKYYPGLFNCSVPLTPVLDTSIVARLGSAWGLDKPTCDGEWLADRSGNGRWPPLVQEHAGAEGGRLYHIIPSFNNLIIGTTVHVCLCVCLFPNNILKMTGA